MHDAAWWGYTGIMRCFRFQFQVPYVQQHLNPALSIDAEVVVNYHLLPNRYNLPFEGRNHHVTPLMLAIFRGHLDVVQYLIGAGANVNRVSHSSYMHRTPLMLACHRGKLDIVKFLLAIVSPNIFILLALSDERTKAVG